MGGSSYGYTRMRDDTRATLVHRWVVGMKPWDERIAVDAPSDAT